MKYTCKWCSEEIEISQSEKAKIGLKSLADHEIKCFKTTHKGSINILNKITNPMEYQPVPRKFDMQGVIKYLHIELGRIPSEGEVLRFHQYLDSKPTPAECHDFVIILKQLR